jgi:hypothetical protein
MKVLSDWQRFVSSRRVGLQDFELEKPWRPSSIVLEVDPPYHDKTRRVLNRAVPEGCGRSQEAFRAPPQCDGEDPGYRAVDQGELPA